MISIAVIGPGCIGGVSAAWLAQDPAFEVTVCARTPFKDLRVETPGGTLIASPRILTEPNEAGPVDWLLVATKVYDIASTKPWLQRLVGSRTRVAVLQNGVEHRERFAGLIPAERILPVVVDIPAERSAPGRIMQHRDGSMIAPAGVEGEDFCALFANTRISASTDPDFRSRMWEKLCLNSAGAVSALTLTALGPVWTLELEKIVRDIVEECAAVARAEGAVIDQTVVERVVDHARNSGSSSINSMHADRLAGRPMEIDARNGAIVRFGKMHGVPTPTNELFVALLRASASPEDSRIGHKRIER